MNAELWIRVVKPDEFLMKGCGVKKNSIHKVVKVKQNPLRYYIGTFALYPCNCRHKEQETLINVNECVVIEKVSATHKVNYEYKHKVKFIT